MVSNNYETPRFNMARDGYMTRVWHEHAKDEVCPECGADVELRASYGELFKVCVERCGYEQGVDGVRDGL